MQFMKTNRARIGGASQRLDFERDENFFSRDMIPPKALQIKQEVEEYIDPDNLELRKPCWNASTFVPKNKAAIKEPFSRKLTKVNIAKSLKCHCT